MSQETHTLIPPREALKIITWTNYKGLYAGSRGTGGLTRFPHGLYSKEECEALRDAFITAGIERREKLSNGRRRQVVTELI